MMNVETFAAIIPSMADKDQSFANSLLASMRSPRGLSEKQAYWVQTLADRASGVKEAGINLEPIAVMIRSAKDAGLAYPKVRLAYEGVTYKITLAGAASKNAGCL